MAEDKTMELQDGELEAVGGGAGVYQGLRITTALSRKCGNFEKGSNFYNKKIMVFGGTCGDCSHLCAKDGWHLCDIPGNY